MTMGGNQKLKEFFNNYQLMEASAHDRLNTRAAQWYRKEIKAKSLGNSMDEPPPTFDRGREPAPIEVNNTYEERMAMNSGSDVPFGQPIPGMNDQGTTEGGEYSEDIKFVKETGKAAL